MPAFNDINGLPCSVNRWLLRDILRERWGFNGMVISDANAIAECVTHGIASDRREAARQAILAGMDMDMTSNSYRMSAGTGGERRSAGICAGRGGGGRAAAQIRAGIV